MCLSNVPEDSSCNVVCVRDFNMRSRDFSRCRQPCTLCQGRNQLGPSVELMRSVWTVSYTHLDVYKRQTLNSIFIWVLLSYLFLHFQNGLFRFCQHSFWDPKMCTGYTMKYCSFNSTITRSSADISSYRQSTIIDISKLGFYQDSPFLFHKPKACLLYTSRCV